MFLVRLDAFLVSSMTFLARNAKKLARNGTLLARLKAFQAGSMLFLARNVTYLVGLEPCLARNAFKQASIVAQQARKTSKKGRNFRKPSKTAFRTGDFGLRRQSASGDGAYGLVGDDVRSPIKNPKAGNRNESRDLDSYKAAFLESAPAVSAKLKTPVTAGREFEDVVKSAQDAAVLVLVY